MCQAMITPSKWAPSIQMIYSKRECAWTNSLCQTNVNGHFTSLSNSMYPLCMSFSENKALRSVILHARVQSLIEAAILHIVHFQRNKMVVRFLINTIFTYCIALHYFSQYWSRAVFATLKSSKSKQYANHDTANSNSFANNGCQCKYKTCAQYLTSILSEI